MKKADCFFFFSLFLIPKFMKLQESKQNQMEQGISHIQGFILFGCRENIGENQKFLQQFFCCFFVGVVDLAVLHTYIKCIIKFQSFFFFFLNGVEFSCFFSATKQANTNKKNGGKIGKSKESKAVLIWNGRCKSRVLEIAYPVKEMRIHRKQRRIQE